MGCTSFFHTLRLLFGSVFVKKKMTQCNTSHFLFILLYWNNLRICFIHKKTEFLFRMPAYYTCMSIICFLTGVWYCKLLGSYLLIQQKPRPSCNDQSFSTSQYKGKAASVAVPRSVLGLASSCLNLSSRLFSRTVIGGAPDAFWSEMRATSGMMGRTGRDCCFCSVERTA